MSFGRTSGGGSGATSGGGSHYEMSLDDVRNYLIQTGSLQEAEKLLSLPSQPQQNQGMQGQGQERPEGVDPMLKITEIKERILREREIEKEKVMRNLLTKHHRGVAELQQEDEEMRKLQIMETKLRDENIQIELMKQKLAEEMKQSKRSQLDDMAMTTRRELEQLEQKRLEMERNMELKRSEIEELQSELRKADDVLLESSKPRDRSVPAEGNGYSRDTYAKEMNQLIEQHTRKLLESKAYELSASQDQQYLRQGIIPAVSLPFNPSLQHQSRSLEQQDESIRLQEERIRQLRDRYSSPSSSSLDALGGQSHLTNSKSGLSLGTGAAGGVAGAGTGAGAADQLNDILDAATTQSMNQMKQLYENKYHRHGTVSVTRPPLSGGGRGGAGGEREEKVSVDVFLDKWLNNEVSSGALLNPTTTQRRNGGEPPLATNSSISSKKSLSDSLDSAMTSSGSEILRSQSSSKSIKPLRQQLSQQQQGQQQQRSQRDEYSLRPTSRGRAGVRQQRLRRDQEQEDPEVGNAEDFVYRQKFQPAERAPRQQRRGVIQSQISEDRGMPPAAYGQGQLQHPTPGYGYGPAGYGMPPSASSFHPSYPPAAGYPPGGYPYGGPPSFAQPQLPYGHGPPPYGQPPYGQPYSVPQQYPLYHQPHTQPYAPQAPPPAAISSPAAAGSAQQLLSMAELLEQENSRLAQLSGGRGGGGGSRQQPGQGQGSQQSQAKSSVDDLLSDLGIHLPGSGDIAQDSSLSSPQGQLSGQGQGQGKRLSRAEIKHREEMKQLQFEMEKLKMTEALEDMKSELGRKKAIKTSEEQHEAWLEEQKRQLQALKIKQALAVEESKLQEATAAASITSSVTSASAPGAQLAPNPNDPNTIPIKPTPAASAVASASGVSAVSSSSYVDNLTIFLDGLFIPQELIKGTLYRLSLALFTSKGKPLGRSVTTPWSRWNQSSSSSSSLLPLPLPLPGNSSSSGGSNGSTLQVIHPPLSRTPPRSNKLNALTCAQRTEVDLGSDPNNFLITLCEIQFKDTEESLLKPLGWCVFTIPIVSPVASALPFPLSGVSGVGEREEMRMFPGLWRVKVRKGISNPQGRQKATVEDATEGWFLCRLTTAAPVVAEGSLRGGAGREESLGCFSNQVSSTESVSSLSQKYLSLEGAGAGTGEREEYPNPLLETQKSNLKLSSNPSQQSLGGGRGGEVEGLEKMNSVQLLRQPTAPPPGTAAGRPLSTTDSRRNSQSSQGNNNNNPSSRPPSSSIANGLRQLSRARLQSSSGTTGAAGAGGGRGLGPSQRSLQTEESKSNLTPNGTTLQLQQSVAPLLNEITSQDEDEEDDTARDNGRDGISSSTNPLDKYWILGTPTAPCSRSDRYQRGDGIDIYLDSAMFLPDNCTVTRCLVKLLSNDFEVIGEPYEVYSALSSAAVASVSGGSSGGTSGAPGGGTSVATSPHFNFKIELRENVFNTTMTLLIRVDTMDAVSLTSCGVGYSVIKLFCNQQREQPVATNDTNVFINSGLYQLPIHAGRLRKGGLFNESILNNLNLPRIPCASLLVRIYPAPKSSDGLLVLSKSDYPERDWERLKLWIPPPSGGYLHGDYDGRLCEPNNPQAIITVFESKAILAVNRAVEVACRQAILSYQSTGQPLPSHISDRGLSLNNNLTLSELNQWIHSLLLPANQIDSTLDSTYALPYDFTSGVSLCIDELHALPEQGLFGSNDLLYKVIYSLNPPGLFYKDPPLAEGLHFTRGDPEKHLTSPLQHPVFSDGFAVFHPTTIEKKLCFLFDIRVIQLSFNKQKGDYDINIDPPLKKKAFWSLLPVGLELKRGSNDFSHIISGCYQIPLIEGSIPSQVISSSDPYQTTLDLLRQQPQKRSKTQQGQGQDPPLRLCDSGSTILVRVLHPLLSQLLSESMKRWQDHINTSYVYEMYNAAAGGTQQQAASLPSASVWTYDMSRFTGAKLIEKQFQKSKDLKKLLKKVNQEFAEFTHIHQDAI